jgi:hypothetical protein
LFLELKLFFSRRVWISSLNILPLGSFELYEEIFFSTDFESLLLDIASDFESCSSSGLFFVLIKFLIERLFV